MGTKPKQSSKIAFYIGSIITWAAVILQLYLALANRVASVPETFIRFFTFFTILSNTLAAICFTSLLISKGVRQHIFFSKSNVVSAVTVYILIVCVVYQVALRHVWNPQGLQKVVDELLHTVDPLYFLLCWTLFIPKYTLQWKIIFAWMIFPLFYLGVILWRGALVGYYPYPFVNVTTLGYGKVLLNCGVVVIVFLLFSIILIGVGKISSKPSMAAF